ncbi:hypothetical protein ABET11_20745 [Priestia megaterium]|uniref:Uncharacterized protein n=3 Tax=Priestia TaxID=2800373 RepID=D5E2T7_PRIM1|nr:MULTISPECIES: hypothetical protein [Priestia]AVX07750.1 hypothetical protein CS527_08510 [Bacillus sp. Y-01]KOP73921.1 hypothetical protein AMS61_06075 [Bacillus sp. FJAT-21351]KQU23471.1 hypothetical protein ASG61_22825 [Bacillus sp. Leaf75]MBZ5478790.1 hypothetical protein [Bacillus sp. T_4]MDH6655373.1 hypothetical protein [Bacillus sp. PvP124]MEB2273653.1 hypothetical protein [Bacillus sp. ILBB4]RFB30341.1 hypothetical protein DZB87_07660 [Bacillus sp. ALD]RFB40261.1 hypothetical pro
MLIGEIIQKLNNGATYEDIASSMKIREDILKNDLKKFGFHYENKEKKLVFTGYESEYENTLRVCYPDIKGLSI